MVSNWDQERNFKRVKDVLYASWLSLCLACLQILRTWIYLVDCKLVLRSIQFTIYFLFLLFFQAYSVWSSNLYPFEEHNGAFCYIYKYVYILDLKLTSFSGKVDYQNKSNHRNKNIGNTINSCRKFIPAIFSHTQYMV